MAIMLDFSSVPSREPMLEGLYVLTIAKSEMKKSNSGNDMLSLEFDVQSDANGEAVPGNRKLWENCSMLPQALFKLKNLLESIGYDTSAAIDFEPLDLIGQSVQASVIQEEYNGEMRNRIKKFFEV